MKEVVVENPLIRRGDHVVVIAGNEKGKTGKVMARNKKRVVIEGVNLGKKHMKATQENPQGQILEVERSIHASNICAADEGGKAVRLRVRENKKGGKELTYLKEGKETVYRTLRKGS